MKNYTLKITFIFVLILIAIAIITDGIIVYFISNAEGESKNIFFLLKDLLFIIASGFTLVYFLNKKDKDNKEIYNKLLSTTNSIIESNERYDIVSKATSDIIWDWNIEEDKIIWNKGITGIFGYSNKDVGNSSKWWFDRIHPEDSLKMSVKLYSFLEQKTQKWQDEYRFQCADGSYKYVLDRGFLLKDNNNKAIRMIGAIQDITKQKEEEQRLRLLETAITQSTEGVLITDADISNKVLPDIIYANAAFSKITGYSFEEIISNPSTVFFGKKSNKKELEKLYQALKEFKECFVEIIAYKKNGEEFWVNFSMIPVTNNEGEHSHWISILRDVTEDKTKEREKEQLIRELTQNNKDLKQFSYITSHNIKAPLSNLIGLLNLIDDIEIDNPELREIIEGFEKSTHLLNETINDLVKIVIIKDNAGINRENLLIKDVFENVFNQLSLLINLHKPILKLDIKNELSLFINKSYLESIFLNLLTNSIKYKSPNRTLKINISSKVTEEYIILKFSDNGIGIDLDRHRDKIFGLYQKFHDLPDSKGLGLYLIKSQVESMGGTISVDSTIDVGTTFTLKFKKNNLKND